MFSMYPDAKIIYREYVQNAFDSINAAVEQNILNKTKDGIVSIKIDPSSRNIVIRDNGYIENINISRTINAIDLDKRLF